MEISKFCEIMGVKMSENEKEIVLKSDAKVTTGEWGPKIGIYGQGKGDAKPYWYNTTEKKVNNPERWTLLCSLKNGERLGIVWALRNYPKADGTQGETRDLLWAERVIQPGDEVKPVVSSAPSPQVDPAPINQPVPRPVQQEWSPKQTCIKSATDIVVAQIGAGQTIDNPIEEIVLKARAIYGDLREAW
jgi:hypothetical protein